MSIFRYISESGSAPKPEPEKTNYQGLPVKDYKFTNSTLEQASQLQLLSTWHESKEILAVTASILERAEQDYNKAVEVEEKARKEVNKITK